MPEKKQPNSPQKKKRTKAASFNPLKQVSLFFKDKHPVFKFLLGFTGCIVVFYLFYYSAFYKNFLEIPFLHFQASISNLLLNLLGHNTTAVGANIGSPDFSVNIQNGCDGLEAIAILMSGILIFPVAFRHKVKGLLWGVGILFTLNLLRIAGLYLAGLYFSKEVFDILHVQGGFIIFTMISVLLLFTWMNWVMKQPK